jgi:Rps23 Pro-64 3,4-dihydroxylase Tpa1-like proline 4-hydroxylase
MQCIEKYKTDYKETGIVVIPSFISDDILKGITYELDNYEWWVYSIRPYNNIDETVFLNKFPTDSYNECLNHHENNVFCYRFKRSYGIHYTTCICISCRLEEFAKSEYVMDTICKIIDCPTIVPNEIFISNYGKDDFLSIHHDIGKGDISATFSLTEDWNPSWGGVLHFCDESKNIYKSVSPQFGSLNLFRLDTEFGLDHFVSTVSVNRNRYTLTAWYTIKYD